MKTELIGFEEYGNVIKTRAEKKEGGHAYAEVWISLYDQTHNFENSSSVRGIMQRTGASAELRCGMFRMHGKVSKIDIEVTYRRMVARIAIDAYSSKTDEVPKYRLFQSPDKTYGNIIAKVMPKCDVCKKMADKKEENVVLQNGETDHAFVKRLAKEQGFKIYDRALSESEAPVINKFIDNSGEKFDTGMANYLRLNCDENGEEIEAGTAEFYELGTMVSINGEKYIVEKTKVYEYDDMIEYSFCARKEKTEEKTAAALSATVLIGEAEVQNNDDPKKMGRIQVSLVKGSVFEDALTGEKIWVEYMPELTEKDGGCIFIPKKGEKVNIIYGAGKLYALGCLRSTAYENAQTQNGTIRLYDRKLEFCEDRVRLTSGKNTISVNDDTVFITNEKFDVSVSPENVVIKGNDTEFKIEAADIIVGAKNAQIKTDAGIGIKGKDIEAKADSSVKINSDSIKMSAKGGITANKVKMN